MEMLNKKPIENRQMSQDLMKKFIEMYRAHPNLWNTNSENYRNKTLKAKSYNALIKLISTEIPNADKKFIAKKINTIRVCFRKEYRKWLENNEYKPMLWYYNLLSFIVNANEYSDLKHNDIYDEESITCDSNFKLSNDDVLFAKSKKSDNKICNSNHKYEETICFEGMKENHNEDVIYSNNDTDDYENIDYFIRDQRSKQQNLKIERLSDSDSQYSILSTNFQKVTQLNLDEFETFGYFIAKKLQKIASTNHEQYIFCENVINQAIMKAQLGKLNEHSSIFC